MKNNVMRIALVLCLCVVVFSAFDKDKPSSSTSLRSSNPEILANWSALETAIGNEHEFSTGGTNSGDHTQGSARSFSQATAPATQIDGGSFVSTDLGSLWVDTDDNAFYMLTATTPTWTPVSTEVIATMLASARVFGSTLGVTGTLTASGAVTVGTTLDVTGVATVAKGSLLASSDAPTTDAMLVPKKYVDDGADNMHDSEGGYNNVDVDGTKTKVYTLYLTGSLDADSKTEVAHGVASGGTKILMVNATAYDDSISKYVNKFYRGTGVSVVNAFQVYYDDTNVTFDVVGTFLQGNAYRIKVDYIL